MFGFGVIIGVLVLVGLVAGGIYVYFKYIKKPSTNPLSK